VTFSIGQSFKIYLKSMRANLQIGSKENMFVNVLESFNDISLKIDLHQIANLICSRNRSITSLIINGMTKSDKSDVDSVFFNGFVIITC
jgi:hypothetical protein